MKRELIIIAFYINVEGLTKKLEVESLAKLVSMYDVKNLPDDIIENYHIEYIWLPIKKGMSKVELIYPSRFNINDINIEDVDLVIEQIQKLKKN